MNKDNEQREIKFRAWNIELEKFFYSDYNDEVNDGREYYPFCFWIGFKGDHHPKMILQQFTGRHDKSGKEIYEGDRIRVERFEMVGYAMSSSGYTDTPDEIYEDCIASVIYSGVSFSFESITCGTVPLDAVLSSNIEVIGNIYSSEPIVK